MTQALRNHILVLASIAALFVSDRVGSQIRIVGLNDRVEAGVLPAKSPPQSQGTWLPSTTAPVEVNHHVVAGGHVAEAVFTKSSSASFFCVGAWSPVDGGQAQGSVLVHLRNEYATPVWIEITGFYAGQSDPWTAAPRFEYWEWSSGTHFEVRNHGAFTFRATLAPGATARLNAYAVASANNRIPTTSQVVASLAFRTTPCSRQSVTSVADGMVTGQGGLPPILSVDGCASSGNLQVGLNLARPAAQSLFALGVPGPGTPLLGGIFHPDRFLTGPVPTGSAGPMGFAGWSVPLSVPATLSGSFAMQALVLDPAAVHGVAMSNALIVRLR